RRGDGGYALVALLAVMAIIAILVTSAAPRMQQQAQRELEKESIARGEEVAEAIYIYWAGMGRLPTSMDDLVNGFTPPGGIKTIYPLRKSAARDPLTTTRDGEWKLVRQNDRVFADFILALTEYSGGMLPTPKIYPRFMGTQQQQQAVTGLVDLKKDEDEEPPGGEDNESNVSGPFIGVVSRSRRKSVLHYYGVERHDRWVFTPLYR
ncbi:MAG TPA: type II secretion system protein, partial [Pyrinomonadaceae bacterium]